MFAGEEFAFALLLLWSPRGEGQVHEGSRRIQLSSHWQALLEGPYTLHLSLPTAE